MSESIKHILSAVLIWLIVVITVFLQVGLITYTVGTNEKHIDNILKETSEWVYASNWLKDAITTTLPNGKRSLPYLHTAVTPEWLSQYVLILYGDIKTYIKQPSPENLPSIPMYELKARLGSQIEGTKEEQKAFAELCLSPLPDKVNWNDFADVSKLNNLAKFYKKYKQMIALSSILIIILITLVIFIQPKSTNSCLGLLSLILISAGILSVLMGVTVSFVHSKLVIFETIDKQLTMVGWPSRSIYVIAKKLVGRINQWINLISAGEIILGVFLTTLLKPHQRFRVIK